MNGDDVTDCFDHATTLRPLVRPVKWNQSKPSTKWRKPETDLRRNLTASPFPARLEAMKKKPIPKEPDRKPEINVFIGVRLDVGEFSKLTERQILAFAEGLAKIWASLGK